MLRRQWQWHVAGGDSATEQRRIGGFRLGDTEGHPVLRRREAIARRLYPGNGDSPRRCVPPRGARQRARQRVKHELVHGARIAEAHLALGRMHVDIDARRIEFEEQHVGRLAVVMQHVLVGLAQRVRQHLVAHEAAVDEKILRIAAAVRAPRQCRQAGEVEIPELCVRPSRRRRRIRRRAPRRCARRGPAPSDATARGRCAAA